MRMKRWIAILFLLPTLIGCEFTGIKQTADPSKMDVRTIEHDGVNYVVFESKNGVAVVRCGCECIEYPEVPKPPME